MQKSLLHVNSLFDNGFPHYCLFKTMSVSLPKDEVLLDQVVGEEEDDFHAELQDHGVDQRLRVEPGDGETTDGGGCDDQKDVEDELADGVAFRPEDGAPVQPEVDQAGTGPGDVGGGHDGQAQEEEQGKQAVVHEERDSGGHAVFQEG